MVDLSIVEAGLVGGGLVAIASAVYGRKESSSWDEVLLFLGFLVGAAMIGIGAWAWSLGEYDISTRLILIFLGLSLFLRAIKGIKLASLIALITGGAVGYGLYWLGKAFELEFLTSTVILVTAFLVLIIVYVIFKFVEDILDMGGVVLGFRSVQFLVGLVAFAEAVLLLLDRSLWYFLS
ncbi:MAG TPA: hypothetical protein PKO24_03845 [Methanomassiliicoccales archaeon]|jgi:hypothetical protein|nr:hypothetical protein [Methanomassiliicoccales archaeon]HQM66817.1 hypothetical protein [Methanomassiliicoccales archaeon]HRR66398.1 hypothetical protein [Methanomassiliicoccales archaeon]